MLAPRLENRLEELGVLRSFSRPLGFNENLYSESLCRSVKYRPDYPHRPSASKEQACQWGAEFVDLNNQQHRYSCNLFVSPQQRHDGQALEISRHRGAVYARARHLNFRQWSRSTRCWSQPEAVWINESSDELNEPGRLALTEIA
jgi:putative transposase